MERKEEKGDKGDGEGGRRHSIATGEGRGNVEEEGG